MVQAMRSVASLLVLLAACEAQPDPPRLKKRPPPPQVQWTVVDSQPELSALAARAASEHKGLMLDVRADWCAPCLDLERKTFTDQAVRRVLDERFLAARLDVTMPTPDGESLQGMVGGRAMPWVVFWTLDKEEAAAFADGKVPPPVESISTYVSAEELLPTLTRLGG
jgi:thiol:disulfide interchange protein